MQNKGFMVADYVYSLHRLLLVKRAEESYSVEIVKDFFEWNTGSYLSSRISWYYAVNARYMGCVLVTPTMITERALIHGATLIDDIKVHIQKRLVEAEQKVTHYEHVLGEARENLNKRRRMSEELPE
jgi:hypothetical protein